MRAGLSSKSANDASRLARPKPANCSRSGVQPGAHLHARPIERRLIEPFFAHALDDRIDRRQELVGGSSRVVEGLRHPEHRPAVVEHAAEAPVDAGIDAACQPRLAHELVIEERVGALRERAIDQPERVPLGREALRHVIGDAKRRAIRQRIGTAGAAFLLLPRLFQVHRRRQFRHRNVREVFLDPGLCLRGFEVAGDHQRSVVRRVIGLEERPHVVERRRVEVLEVAVEIVGVVPVLVRGHRQVDPREPAVGLVQDVDLDLVLDDLLLVLQVLGIDVQPAHAIALAPQDGFEHVRRNDFEVIREVEPRGAIQEPSVRFDEANELHLAKVLRSLEHHVLEEVREPRLVLRLVAEADVVVQRDHHRRRRGVARQDDLEPILQLEVVSRNRELAGGRRRGACAATRRAGDPAAPYKASSAAAAIPTVMDRTCIDTLPSNI